MKTYKNRICTCWYIDGSKIEKGNPYYRKIIIGCHNPSIMAVGHLTFTNNKIIMEKHHTFRKDEYVNLVMVLSSRRSGSAIFE